MNFWSEVSKWMNFGSQNENPVEKPVEELEPKISDNCTYWLYDDKGVIFDVSYTYLYSIRESIVYLGERIDGDGTYIYMYYLPAPTE